PNPNFYAMIAPINSDGVGNGGTCEQPMCRTTDTFFQKGADTMAGSSRKTDTHMALSTEGKMSLTRRRFVQGSSAVALATSFGWQGLFTPGLVGAQEDSAELVIAASGDVDTL